MSRPTTTPADTAAGWVARRDRGLTTAEAAELERWLGADPAQREEFDRIDASFRSLNGLSANPSLADETELLIARARARRTQRRFWVLASGWMAAAACVAFFLYFAPVREGTSSSYQVVEASSRELRLPDGSVVLLRGNTRVEAHYSPAERRVRLIEGEALFTVAKNPARPFLVSAGPATVRAVGTAFNIRLGASVLEVMVTEGRIRVDDAAGTSLLPAAETGVVDAGVLSAGNKIVVALSAAVASPALVTVVTPADTEQALAWQATQLVFEDTSLDEVVAAFNRYNAHRLTLGDSSLATRRITGTFRADNLDGFLRLLEAGVDVRAETRAGQATVLRPAR